MGPLERILQDWDPQRLIRMQDTFLGECTFRSSYTCRSSVPKEHHAFTVSLCLWNSQRSLEETNPPRGYGSSTSAQSATSPTRDHVSEQRSSNSRSDLNEQTQEQILTCKVQRLRERAGHLRQCKPQGNMSCLRKDTCRAHRWQIHDNNTYT